MTARHSSFMLAASTAAAVIAMVLCAAGCGGAPIQARPAPEVASSVTTSGQTIYFGTVFPLEAATNVPSFIYERRVDEHDGSLVSTHITRDPSGTVAIAESATHSLDYALADYTLHANQLGQTGSIHIEKDHVSFHLVDATSDRSQVEQQTAPVVVGPTLVGYVVRHLEALRRKEVIGVRLAVLDRLETIGFDLSLVDGLPGQTRVKMTPSSFVYAMVVDPLYFTFETATGKLLRLEGRVPPKLRAGDSWDDFDARVEYRFVADTYR